MVIAGLGFFAKNVTKLLAPAYSSDLLLAPMFLNVVVVAMWMLVRGVDQAKWDREVANCQRSAGFVQTQFAQGEAR
jgi:hypothetical protein